MKTYAINRLKMEPLPMRMNPTRTSLRARTRLVSLSCILYTTDTQRRNKDCKFTVHTHSEI
jgi:hypothetical protein